MNRPKLPIGIQTFFEIREEGYCYVDKTPLIHHLANEGKCYFLSRPRRFGKSLILTTLEEAFEGNRALFKGLHLENHWDWSKQYPVIRLDFGEGVLQTGTRIQDKAITQFKETAGKHKLTLEKEEASDCLHELIVKLHAETGRKVVVLIDEYDKPILDNIEDEAVATEMREALRNIYSVLKSQDAHLRFVFLTGVSKFSKVSLFSGLNNLQDISLDPRYACLCGYTQAELEHTFADYLQDVDLEKVKQWYNGYNFLGEPVYNPFDVLLFLNTGEYHNWWFETGTPSFLVKLLKQRHYVIPGIDGMEVSRDELGMFDVDYIGTEALLYQTGYLTIREQVELAGSIFYKLGYPNKEVAASLPRAIVRNYTRDPRQTVISQKAIFYALDADQPADLQKPLESFFASIPHDWYRKNRLAEYEGYYASITYCLFAALGLEVIPEDTTNHGQIDLTIKLHNRIFILEFKVTDLSEPGNALKQIKDKNYAGKYQNQRCRLIGIEFSREERNIVNFEWE